MRRTFREKILRGPWDMKCFKQGGRQRPGLLPRAGACYTSISCLTWRPALGRLRPVRLEAEDSGSPVFPGCPHADVEWPTGLGKVPLTRSDRVNT